MAASRRILHVVTRYLRAGSERNLAYSMEWERAAGFEVELATSSTSELGELNDRFRVHLIEALCRELSPRRDVAATRQLRDLMYRGAYDIVHTHQSKAGILGRLAASGRVRRVVHTVHMASFGSGYNPMASMAFRIAEKRASRLTDVTVFVGDELRAIYVDAGVCHEDDSMVIRSPIDVTRLAEARDETTARRLDARRTHGLPVDRRLIVWIGALSPRKRPVTAVRSLYPLLASGEATLAIAGEGPERRAVEAAAAAHGVSHSVHLLGHVNDIRSVLASADVVAHTSVVEGVPQVVIQALAAGQPVVATDVVGLREVRPAPITIVSRSGTGMARAVSRRMRARPAPVPLVALKPWTTHVIDEQLGELHERLS